MPAPKPLHWRRNLLLVWIAQFLATGGFCLATPFIPFYIQEIGITVPSEVSMWAALHVAGGNLALLISAPFWGFLSDLYGRRMMMLRATFVSALLMPLMAFVPGPASLVALRFVVGLFAGTVTAAQILVSSNTPVKHRGFALGALCSAVYGGRMAGTFLGGLLVDLIGYRWTFLICGLVLFSSSLLVYLGVSEVFHVTSTLRHKLQTFRFRLPDLGTAWLLLALILLMGFAIRFDAPFMALLVKEIHGPDKAATWTGVIASLSALAGVLSGSFLGWLADRFSPGKVAIWSASLAGVLMIPQGLATNLPTLLVARLGMVFFVGGLASIFQIWLAKSTPDEKRGTTFGWATSFKSCGWFLSSLASGTIAMNFGVRWVYFAAAVVFILLAVGTKVLAPRTREV